MKERKNGKKIKEQKEEKRINEHKNEEKDRWDRRKIWRERLKENKII